MVKAESKIRINWQPISDAIQVHYEPKTELQLGLGYTRVLGHQYLYIRVFIRIRVYMD